MNTRLLGKVKKGDTITIKEVSGKLLDGEVLECFGSRMRVQWSDDDSVTSFLATSDFIEKLNGTHVLKLE